MSTTIAMRVVIERLGTDWAILEHTSRVRYGLADTKQAAAELAEKKGWIVVEKAAKLREE